LIQPNLVLTNAYCVQPEAPGDYVVVAGTNHVGSYSQADGAGQTIWSKGMFRHEDYDERTKANDIALIELASPARSESMKLRFDRPKSPKAPWRPVTGWGLLRDIRGGRDHETGEVVRNDDPNYYTNELMQVEVSDRR